MSSDDKLPSNDYSANLEVLSSPKPATDGVENTSNDSCKVNSETQVEMESETDKSEECRKSSRSAKKPDWLNDYVEDVDEVMLVNDIDMNDAKMKDLESWRENKLYHEVPHRNQKCVSTRWVYSFKTVNNSLVPKASNIVRIFRKTPRLVHMNHLG